MGGGTLTKSLIISLQVIISIYDVNGLIASNTTVTESMYRLTDILPRTLCCAEIYAVSTCSDLLFTGIPSRICDETMAVAPASVSNLIALNYTIGIESFSLSWDPPQNLVTVQGVIYSVAINNRSLIDLTDVTFLHVGDLSPCSTYIIEVSAIFFQQSGPGSMITVTTLSLLSPPENVSFFNGSGPGMLHLMWMRPSEFACGDSIQSYRLRLRCNQLSREVNIPSSLTSTVIDISDETLGIGWCVATFQSCDADFRCGNFSTEATAPLYQSRPSTPRCLLQMQSTSTNVSISFVVSQPFLTNSTRIEWNLSSTNSFLNGSYDYTFLSSNILDFPVDSNSAYRFNLMICDIYGCSDSCDIEFKTSVSLIMIPRPLHSVAQYSLVSIITYVHGVPQHSCLVQLYASLTCAKCCMV